MKLADLQHIFFDAIISQDETCQHQITQHGELTNQQRMSIYQNAYSARLKETIETDHELLGRYLGDNLFDEMVAGYIKAFPSGYRSLRHFCENLPKFLSSISGPSISSAF